MCTCKRINLPKSADLDLAFAQSCDEYSFCRWLATVIVSDSPHSGILLFDAWLAGCNVSQPIFNNVSALPVLLLKFCIIQLNTHYLSRRLALFERHAIDKLYYFVRYEYFGIFVGSVSARADWHILLLSGWMSIELPIVFAALLPQSFFYVSNLFFSDPNSGSCAILYKGWVASFAHHVL